MKIAPDLRNELAALITNEVPIAANSEGRDTLLVGIENQNGWTRSSNNIYQDIQSIIGYLDHYFGGKAESKETWGLLRFIDNALDTIKGTSVEEKLKNLRQRCISCLEGEQIKPSQLSSASNADSIKYEKTPVPSSPSEQADLPESPSSPPPSHPSNDNVAGESTFSSFFEKATCSIKAALIAIEDAENAFKPSFKVPDPVKRRVALKHLGSVDEHLYQLGDHLEKTSPLPEVVAKKRYLLRDLIHRLLEHVRALRDWINESSGAHQNILEMFDMIKQVFAELYVLKGENEDHKQIPNL